MPIDTQFDEASSLLRNFVRQLTVVSDLLPQSANRHVSLEVQAVSILGPLQQLARVLHDLLGDAQQLPILGHLLFRIACSVGYDAILLSSEEVLR